MNPSESPRNKYFWVFPPRVVCTSFIDGGHESGFSSRFESTQYRNGESFPTDGPWNSLLSGMELEENPQNDNNELEVEVWHLLGWQSVQISFTLIRPENDTITWQEISAQPAFTGRWNDWTEDGKITSVIDLPVFCTSNKHSPLVCGATSHRDCIQTSNLLRFIFVNRLGIFVFIANECPHLDSSSCCDCQHYIVLALGWPQYVQRWDPVGIDLGWKTEQNFEAERIHHHHFSVVAVAEETNVVTVRHMVGLDVGVNLCELHILTAFAVNQIPSAHFTTFRRRNQEIIVLVDGRTGKTQDWCSVSN